MARSRSAANAERDVVRVCHSGLDVGGVQAQVLRSLRRLVPVDVAFFATADPVTLQFTGAHSEEPLVAAAPRFLANELAGADVNTFTSLATSATHVATLDSATGRSRLESERYRELMRPLGLGDELRAALVAGSECWGYLCLHRADGPLGFSRREAAVVARLGPHIAHALRLALLGSRGPVRSDDRRPGVLLVTDDVTPVASTPEAEHLLSLLDPGPGGALPVAVHAVVATLSAIERGSAPRSRLPRATVRTRDGGWLDVHASRLQGSSGTDRVTVVLEPACPHTAAAVQLAAYGLTRRENEVATRVLRGESEPGHRRCVAPPPSTPCTTTSSRSSTRPACVAAASSPGGCWAHSGRGEPGPRACIVGSLFAKPAPCPATCCARHERHPRLIIAGSGRLGHCGSPSP